MLFDETINFVLEGRQGRKMKETKYVKKTEPQGVQGDFGKLFSSVHSPVPWVLEQKRNADKPKAWEIHSPQMGEHEVEFTHC